MPRGHATYVPSVKPKVGLRVTLAKMKGNWQIISQAPDRGTWWLVALDDDARESSDLSGGGATRKGGGYTQAVAENMYR